MEMNSAAGHNSTPVSVFSRFSSKSESAHPSMSQQNNGSELQRSRSQTEGEIGAFASTSLDGTVNSTEPTDASRRQKQRLYELFALIEKEMDALHVENFALRTQLEAQSEEKPAFDPETPISKNFVVQTVQNELEQKMGGTGSAKKTSQSRQQRWKSAFKNPSSKLTLKAFNGHSDGVWHLSTAQVGSATYIVASASADQTAKVWFAEQGTHPVVSYSGHKGSVNSVAIRPESNRVFSAIYAKHLTLLTCGGDRAAHIWSINLEELLEQRREKENDEAVQHIHQPLARLNGHSDVVAAGDWLFGGEQIITASWDRTANLFDAETGKTIKVLSGHDRELTSCSAHPTQKLVATASRDFTFRLWDFRDPIHSVAVFQGHNASVTSVVFSALHHIVSGSDDRTVKVWDLRNMRSPISAIRLDSAANRISICTYKNLLAIPQDNRNISVYDLNGNKQARISRSTRKSHHRSVSACAWLSDHPLNNLITCGFDKQIIGWRVHLSQSAGMRT
uniref:WD repeat-containing protein 37 n=1 Tax=Globodera rostochiensis TaxID=31243 RepID=A0A914IDB8_GLORO